MNPQETSSPDPEVRVDNTLSVTQPGESQVCTIKRHPIGILTIYVTSGLLLFVTALLAFVAAPDLFSDENNHQVMLAGALVFVIVTVVCLVFSLIATKVYWGNSWVVTTDSVTQVTQSSLFNRQSSQLSLENVEDVTAEQNGILTHMFNYGVLKVETAGEHSKFVFTYCPNPNYYAQRVLAAREAFEQHGRIEESVYQQAPETPSPPTS